MTNHAGKEPTEAQVEAAAKAIWDIDDSQVLDPPWDRLDEKFKRHYRTLARAALVAAAGVAALDGAPEPESRWEYRGRLQSCGYVAEVVRGLRFNDAGCWAGGIDCTESVSDHADVIARAVVEAIWGESQ